MCDEEFYFPDELLLYIMLHMPVKTLGNCARVNRRWHRVSQDRTLAHIRDSWLIMTATGTDGGGYSYTYEGKRVIFGIDCNSSGDRIVVRYNDVYPFDQIYYTVNIYRPIPMFIDLRETFNSFREWLYILSCPYCQSIGNRRDAIKLPHIPLNEMFSEEHPVYAVHIDRWIRIINKIVDYFSHVHPYELNGGETIDSTIE